MTFHVWLQDQLTAKGWSGAELARRVGVSPGAVNKRDNGKAKPTRLHIPALARALDRSEQDVWDAVREATFFQGRDSEVMRALNLPPDMTPQDARFLHLAYRAFRQWSEETSREENADRENRHAS